MTNRTPIFPALSVARPLAIASLAGLCLASGCDRRSPTAKAVEHSSTSMIAISGGSPVPAPDATQKSVYTTVSNDLKQVSTDAAAGEKAAAMLLVSQAEQGLGLEPADAAAGATGSMLRKMNEVSDSLAAWTFYQSLASAADGLDVSGEMQKLEQRKGEKLSEAAEQQKQVESLNARLADLSAKAKAKFDAADAKTAEYNAATQRAVKLSAREAAPIVEAANVKRREGDALRLEGSRIQAQADQIAPQVSEVRARVEQLTNQAKDIQRTMDLLQSQVQGARAQAGENKAAAEQAAARLDAAVAELREIRDTQLLTSLDRAEKQYQGALRSAQGATTNADKAQVGAGKMAVGSIQLGLATLQWDRAHANALYATLLERVAGTRPALAKASEYAAGAKEARDAQKAALAGATASLESAQATFAGVPVQGPVKERLAALADLVGKAADVTKGSELDLPATFGFEPVSIGAESPESGVKKSLARVLNAAKGGKPEDLVALVKLPSDAMRPAVQSMLAASQAFQKADAACKAKYNESAADVLKKAPGIGAMIAQQMESQKGKGFDPASLAGLSPADFTIAVSGDRATATSADSKVAVQFVQDGDRWLVTIPELAAAGPMLAASAKMMEPMTQAINDWAAGIESGSLADDQAAANDFMAKLQPIMKSMMGGPG